MTSLPEYFELRAFKNDNESVKNYNFITNFKIWDLLAVFRALLVLVWHFWPWLALFLFAFKKENFSYENLTLEVLWTLGDQFFVSISSWIKIIHRYVFFCLGPLISVKKNWTAKKFQFLCYSYHTYIPFRRTNQIPKTSPVGLISKRSPSRK